MPPCNTCGRDNPVDAAFCVYCGAQLPGRMASDPTTRVPIGDVSATRTSAALLETLRSATLGEYEILGELGRGGMAVVYLAHDLALDRKVAIKVISPTVLWMGEGIPERFKREARTAASLSHPNIIPIYAVKESEDLLFFVMKYVKGRTLESVIAEIGPLPIPMVHTILGQVGNALGYAHRHGVVHRDIKPGNIMLDEEGWAVVTDFGIAKVAEAQGLTQTGGTVGTPAYMSPEQCTGLAVSGHSDQYSLGCVAYEMLTGQKPFAGKSAMAIMYKHCNTPPPPVTAAVPECPPGMVNAVMRMMAKGKEDRWQSLEEMVSSLGPVPPAESDKVRTQILTLAKSADAQRLVDKFQTPPSPVPRDRLSDSIALATRARDARQESATPPADVTPIPGLQPGNSRKLLWALPPAAAAAVVLVLWAPWRADAPAEPASPTATDTIRTPPPIAVPTVAAVEVLPASASLIVGDTVRLSANVLDTQGSQMPSATVTWESMDASVARVSSRGLVSAITTGEAEIVARTADITASTFITVRTRQAQATSPTPPRPRVTSVRVNPSSASLALGETAQLSAIVRDQNGNTIRQGVTWESSDNGVAVVTAQGLVVARGEGSARISATAAGRSGTTTVTVAPAEVASMVVSPTRSSIPVGGTVQLRATPRDAGGNPMQGRGVTWATDNGAIARVASNGVVTGVTPGSVTISARSGSAEASARITVEAPAAVGDAGPSPPPDPSPEIRTVLQGYAQAIQGRDLASLKRLFPGMSSQQEQGFRTFFGSVEELTVSMTVLDLQPSGDSARANVRLRYEFRDGGQQDQTNDFAVTLARGAQGWYITGVGAR